VEIGLQRRACAIVHDLRCLDAARPEDREQGFALADRFLAEKAGVTKATASRVLNNRYNGFSVRPEVKRRILEAAVEIGYAPDLVARGLRAERMNLVGAVGLQPPYVVVDDVFLAIVDVLSREGVHLSLHLAPSAEAADRPPPWRVDGLFVISTESAEIIKPIDASGLPYVTLNAPSGPNGAAVLFDDEQGTRLAMQHLADLGHRRIAYANADAPGTIRFGSGIGATRRSWRILARPSSPCPTSARGMTPSASSGRFARPAPRRC